MHFPYDELPIWVDLPKYFEGGEDLCSLEHVNYLLIGW